MQLQIDWRLVIIKTLFNFSDLLNSVQIDCTKWGDSEISLQLRESSSPLIDQLILSGPGPSLDHVMNVHIMEIEQSFPNLRTISLQNDRVCFHGLLERLNGNAMLTRLEIFNVYLRNISWIDFSFGFSMEVAEKICIAPCSKAAWNSCQKLNFFNQLQKQCEQSPHILSDDHRKSLVSIINQKNERVQNNIKEIISG